MATMQLSASEVELIKLNRNNRLRPADQLLMELHLLNVRLRSAKTDIPHDELALHLKTLGDTVDFLARVNGEAVGDREGLPFVIKRPGVGDGG